MQLHHRTVLHCYWKQWRCKTREFQELLSAEQVLIILGQLVTSMGTTGLRLKIFNIKLLGSKLC